MVQCSQIIGIFSFLVIVPEPFSLFVLIYLNRPKNSLGAITPNFEGTLLAFIALSATQSSAQTHIHSAIMVIDTSNNA